MSIENRLLASSFLLPKKIDKFGPKTQFEKGTSAVDTELGEYKKRLAALEIERAQIEVSLERLERKDKTAGSIAHISCDNPAFFKGGSNAAEGPCCRLTSKNRPYLPVHFQKMALLQYLTRKIVRNKIYIDFIFYPAFKSPPDPH